MFMTSSLRLPFAALIFLCVISLVTPSAWSSVSTLGQCPRCLTAQNIKLPATLTMTLVDNQGASTAASYLTDTQGASTDPGKDEVGFAGGRPVMQYLIQIGFCLGKILRGNIQLAALQKGIQIGWVLLRSEERRVGKECRSR